MSKSDWIDLGDPPDTHRKLFREVGRVYAPFKFGNTDAVERGAERVECEIDGQPWGQEFFAYQAKCLRWLREAYAALDGDPRSAVDRVLE